MKLSNDSAIKLPAFIFVVSFACILAFMAPLFAGGALTITYPVSYFDSLPDVTENTAASITCRAEGGQPPYTWDWWFSDSGQDPQGLHMDSSTGVIGGTPTDRAGDHVYSVNIRVTDAAGTARQKLFLSLHVIEDGFSTDPLEILQPGSLPLAMEGHAIEQTTFAAAGGDFRYEWVVTGAPEGLTSSTNSDDSGQIEGTPIVGSGDADYDVTFTVTDDINTVVSRTLTMHVCAPVEFTSPSDLGNIQPDQPFEYQLESGFGFLESDGHYTYTAPNDDLPDWLALDEETSILSGMPLGDAIHVFTIEVSDQWSPPTTARMEFTLEVGNSTSSPVEIRTETMPQASVDVAYSVTLLASGGTGGFVWDITDLPQGLEANADGVISGVPQVDGVYPVDVRVRDVEFATNNDRTTLTLLINPADGPPSLNITTTVLPRAMEGEDYDPVLLEASGGAGGYLWEAMGLPNGLALAESVVRGAPLVGTAGSHYIQFTVTDAEGASASTILMLVIEANDTSDDGSGEPTTDTGHGALLSGAAPAGACSLVAKPELHWPLLLMAALVLIRMVATKRRIAE